MRSRFDLKDDSRRPGIAGRVLALEAQARSLLFQSATKPGRLSLILLVVPVLLALAWDTVGAPSASLTIAAARNMAAGRDWEFGLVVDQADAVPRSAAYTWVVALAGRLGNSLPRATLLISALGWSALALALFHFARIQHGTLAAIVVLALIAANPLMLSILGTEATWTAALAWFAGAALLRRRWLVFDVLVALLLLAHVGLTSWTLCLLLAALKWRETRCFPLYTCGLVAVSVVAWYVWATRSSVGLSSVLLPSPVAQGCGFERLLQESEFYWLYLPPIVLGLVSVLEMPQQKRTLLWMTLVCLAIPWLSLSLAGYGAPAECGLVSLVVYASGIGLSRAIRWLRAQEMRRSERWLLYAALSTLLVLPLGAAQYASVDSRFQERPLARHALELHVSDWLATRSARGEVVLGPPSIDYPIDRPALVWDGRTGLQAEMSGLLDTLRADVPSFVVSRRGIAWDGLTRAGWFTERYQLAEEFRTPYDAVSPVSIWRYRSADFDGGVRRSADLALAEGVQVVGYRYWPEQVSPGAPVYVVLSLASSRPVTAAFGTVVRVYSPLDGQNWAQREALTPHSIPVDWWRAGQTIDERYVLTTTVDTPVGAYELDVFARGGAHLRQVLGYVSVPWKGTTAEATPVGATFADQILLTGYETAEIWQRGQQNPIALYWEGIRQPEDNYTVFVHLVSLDGRYITGHDGPPMDGRYPTMAWLPGDVIPDAHPLELAPEIVPGTYWLKAGMYRPRTLERLPVRTAEGLVPPDRILGLRTIQVR